MSRRKAPVQRSGGVSAPSPLEQRLAAAFTAVDRRFEVVEELIDALADAVGRVAVEAVVARRCQEKSDAALRAAVESGQLVPVDDVGDDSLVSGVELAAERKPSPVRLAMAQFIPEVRAQLIGKRVGDAIQTPAGTTFRIDAIHNLKTEV